MKNVIFSLFAFTAIALSVQAQQSEPVVTPEVTAQLISESSHLVPGQTVDIGLFLDIKDHWHVYWVNPGDSGLPPEIEWELPEGFTIGEIQWPAPENIPTPPLATFGYEDQVLLIVPLRVPGDAAEGETVTIKASAKWLVCKEVCLPGSADMTLQIPVKSEPPAPSPQASVFEKTRPMHPVTDHHLELSAQKTTDRVILTIPAAAVRSAEDDLRFFPYQADQFEHAAEQIKTPEGDSITLSLPLNLNPGEAHPQSLHGVLVSSGGWAGFPGRKALEVETAYSLANAPDAKTKERSMVVLLFSAFIGGLILNLMPCVFPVLGLKIMGFVEQAGAARGKIMAHGLWFTVGVVVSFWVLAGILIAIRAGGAELGWGFQLQSPMFVFSLCLLLLVFALNLSGVFEVGTTLTSVGGTIVDTKGYSGSFFSGTLATLVATPCAAPVLAPALGAALALPAASSMLVFTFVALGLSLPYLLLSMFPSLIEKLPRPGAWMETVRQAMAFLLYGTVAYLVWVLLGQVDERGSQLILFSLVIAALGAWVYGRYATLSASGIKLWVARIVALSLLLTSIQLGRNATTPTEIQWEKWSPERVEQLRDHRPVYVDFTARWCVTCQVNKRVVFDSDKVIAAFKKMNIAPLKADWTNQDPQITRALESFGRSAVPFNLIYLPGQDDPIILPELLTPDIVLNALNNS